MYARVFHLCRGSTYVGTSTLCRSLCITRRLLTGEGAPQSRTPFSLPITARVRMDNFLGGHPREGINLKPF